MLIAVLTKFLKLEKLSDSNPSFQAIIFLTRYRA
jgi:hypothetical protein